LEKQLINYKPLIFLIQAIFSLIFVLAVFAQQELTLDDLFVNNKLSSKSLKGFQWIPGTQQFSYLEKNSTSEKYDFWSYDTRTGQRKLLIDSQKLAILEEIKQEKRFKLSNYQWSSSGQEILLPFKTGFRLYNIKTQQLKILVADHLEKRDPQLSPDGKKVMYLKNDNIFILNLLTGQEIQITTQGKKYFWVGRFDWVYEEEFGIRTGFCWSPDSRHIAYYQVDERHEAEFPIVDFIPTHNITEPMHYPKAGDRNAIVKIGVVDLEKLKTVWIDTGAETDIYFPRIQWLPDGQTLAIYRLNRDQNKLELLFADIKTGQTRIILTEEEKSGWLSVNSDLIFLKDNQHFLWRSDRDNWWQIYLYKINGELVRQVTHGEWEVEKIVGVAVNKNQIYFTANRETVLEKHLYRISLDGKNLQRLTSSNESHTVKMTPDLTHFVDYYSNANQPTKIRICNNHGDSLRTVEENEIVDLNIKQLPQKKFFTFDTEDGETLNAFMICPLKMDPAKKYPVLFNCYGGPGSQIVNNSWGRGDLWHRMLAQKGIIVFGIDNRGTRGRGAKFMKQVYRRLGDFEVSDHIRAVKYLKKLPYVDETRIGIWGWSYGGYTTCMCLLKGCDHFNLGVAVASVTDWRNYDTIYTERFMDQPEDNPVGYESSSTMTYAHQLKGQLLLIHGSADDNVHLSNTMQLAYKLQEAGKNFEMAIYPRKMHGIKGVKRQLYQKITQFILNGFGI